MRNLAVAHFRSVLGPPACTPLIASSNEWFQNLLNYTLPPAQRSQMLLIPSVHEIQNLMFKLNPNKAPGPDGLTSGFSKLCGTLLGKKS